MTDIDAFSVGSLAIRLLNAALWTALGITVLQHDRPVPPLVRKLITAVVILGMWTLAFGAVAVLVPAIPSEVARIVYTAFTAFAAIIAAAILMERTLD